MHMQLELGAAALLKAVWWDLHLASLLTHLLSHHTVVWLGYLVYFVVTNFSNTFLVHHLADCDEIWHGYGYWCMACLLPFW